MLLQLNLQRPVWYGVWFHAIMEFFELSISNKVIIGKLPMK